MRHSVRTTLLLAGLCVALGPLTQAEARPIYAGTPYLGLQHSSLSLTSDRTLSSASPDMLDLRAGYFLFDHMALEARYGTGVKNDRLVRADQGRTKVSVDRYAGAYGSFHFPFATTSSVYLFGGLSHFKAEFEREDATFEDSDEGLSFGFGYQINTGDHFGLNLEYARFLEESGHRVVGYTVGAQVYF